MGGTLLYEGRVLLFTALQRDALVVLSLLSHTSPVSHSAANGAASELAVVNQPRLFIQTQMVYY